jgi:hypothetical protein
MYVVEGDGESTSRGACCRCQYVSDEEWRILRRHLAVDTEISITRIADDNGCVSFFCEPGVYILLTKL